VGECIGSCGFGVEVVRNGSSMAVHLKARVWEYAISRSWTITWNASFAEL
jgi:hypothetical protein